MFLISVLCEVQLTKRISALALQKDFLTQGTSAFQLLWMWVKLGHSQNMTGQKNLSIRLQIPEVHRIFSKSSTMSDIGEEKLITSEDSHYVFVRPKAIVGSSGSTWGSETARLRQRNPNNFEVKDSGESYRVQFRQSCALIHNVCYLYQDMTEESDFTKATGLENCVYTCYENERLQRYS